MRKAPQRGAFLMEQRGESKDQLQLSGGQLRGGILAAATVIFAAGKNANDSPHPGRVDQPASPPRFSRQQSALMGRFSHGAKRGIERSVATVRWTVARGHIGRRNHNFCRRQKCKRFRVRTAPGVIWRRRRHQIDRRCCSSFSGANPLRWASRRFLPIIVVCKFADHGAANAGRLRGASSLAPSGASLTQNAQSPFRKTGTVPASVSASMFRPA